MAQIQLQLAQTGNLLFQTIYINHLKSKTMKTLKHTLLIASLLFSCAAFSQSNKEDIDLIQATYGKSKKELIKEYMQLGEAKAAAFWKVYDEFEAERKALGREKIRLIEDYANHYKSLTDAKADEISKAAIQNNISMEKMNAKYYDKFSQAVGGITASKFMQMEVYLQTTVRNIVQEEIPFIHEMDASQKH